MTNDIQKEIEKINKQSRQIAEIRKEIIKDMENL